MLTHRHESKGFISSSVDQVLAHIDDHTRLSSHMGEPSWKMGGGRMETVLDAGRGQMIGSHIRMTGRVLGVEFAVEEVVTERNLPYRKVWETTGTPQLLVIGRYRMGFELSPQGEGTMLNGASARVTVIVQPTNTFNTNTASVASSTQDNFSTNNAASVTTRAN